MKNKIFLSALIVLLAFGVIYLFFQKENSGKTEKNDNRIKVVSTLFPTYDFAKKIGGEKADVQMLLPPGVESHSFEPKPSDIVRINQARIFIYTGKYMEPWAGDILSGVKNNDLQIVDSSFGVNLMKEGEDHEHEEEHEHEHEEDHHDHGGFDPHIWLDFNNAIKMGENILLAFKKADSQNADFYEANFATLKAELNKLDEDYKQSLSNCVKNEFIHAGHFAFGYLANRYGLKYESAQGVSPDSEPTPNQLILLSEQIKEHGLKYIYYEELIDPKIGRTISEETGAELLLLNGAHNLSKDDFQKGVDFVTIMKENLTNLKKGLECQL